MLHTILTDVDFTFCIAELKGGQHFFSATKEGDNVLFATDDEKECRVWVAALYKSTGQSHKPTPPTSAKLNNNNPAAAAAQKSTTENACTNNTTTSKAVKR